jgi:5-methylcytosine-specific restriction endonuclease McrA
MKTWSLNHLEDHAPLCALTQLVTQDRATTAALLAHIVEVEERRLYLYEACPSMFVYCKRVLHLSESATYKRIHAARAARRFPAIFGAIADGRLHLSAVVTLAPHLKSANADELLVAATHKTRAEVEELIAARFPCADLPTVVRPLPPAVVVCEQAAQVLDSRAPQQPPGAVVPSDALKTPNGMGPLAGRLETNVAAGLARCHALHPESPATQDHGSPAEVTAPNHAPHVAPNTTPHAEPRARLTPLSPGRYAIQVTVDQETHELLREAKDLLGHSVPSGDIAEVLKRALGLLVQKLKAQKYGRTPEPRPQDGESNGRHIPAEIRRIVSERDGDQCTFVSASGRRCEARSSLQFDHLRPFACGGKTSVENLRLMCGPHNLHLARVVYGAALVHERQAASRREGAETRKHAADLGQHRPAASPTLAGHRIVGVSARRQRDGAGPPTLIAGQRA